jgi:hypothetical protein
MMPDGPRPSGVDERLRDASQPTNLEEYGREAIPNMEGGAGPAKASETMKETASAAVATVQSIGETAKENLVWATEKIQEKAPELWEKAKENAEWATEKLQEKAPEAWEKAKENAEWAKEKVTENAEWAKDKMTETAKEDLPWIWEGIKENAVWAGQKAKDTLTSVKESVLPRGPTPPEEPLQIPEEPTSLPDLSSTNPEIATYPSTTLPFRKENLDVKPEDARK